MDIVERLREHNEPPFDYIAHEAADMIEQLRGQVDFERECREDTYADLEKQDAEIERLRGVLLTVLEACKDVNSPDRKVREEITRTVRKALKEEK